MGSFVHCNVQYLYFYFLIVLFMNHCNDFAPCGPSIGQYKFFFFILLILIVQGKRQVQI